MVVIFSTFKPIKDERTQIAQYNALMSWAALPGEKQIVVFGDEEGVTEMCEDVALRIAYREFPESHTDILHWKDGVGRNEHGTPLVSWLFHAASEHLTQYPVLCYVNGDIILTSSFMRGIEAARAIREKFLMVGRRINLHVEDEIDFTDKEWETKLLAHAKEKGHLAIHAAIDYFIHSRGLWSSIPDMALARYHWDNHLCWLAGSQEQAMVVDASALISVVHQDHPTAVGFDAPEAQANAAMAQYRVAGIEHSSHHLTPDGELRGDGFWRD